MRAISLSIYENKEFGNSSNNGISSRYNEVLIACDDGFIEIDEDNMPENLVRLVVRNIRGREYMHLEPYKSVDKGCVGWMFGGTYAGCSDSRFTRISQYPLPIHDRQESQELYDSYFN